MRVEVDLERIKYPGSGLGQVCMHLLSELSHRRDIDVTAFMPKTATLIAQTHVLQHEPSVLHKILGVKTTGINVWHCTHQGSHYLPRNPNVRVVLTIHDLNFLQEKKSPGKIQSRLHKIQRLIDRSSAVTTISNFSKGEILKHLQLGNRDILVIPNGAEPSQRDHKEAIAFLNKKKFMFAVGVMAEKKNFSTLIPMLKHMPLDVELVIGGGPENSIFHNLKRMCIEHGVTSRVHLLGYVPAPKRNWLYENAQIVLVPSLLEGFGLPVIEAMFYGRPVACSRRTSLPEVGGELAHYWDSYDPKEMARVVLQAISNYEQNPLQYQARCRGWVSPFQWANVVDQYINVYKRVAREF